MTYNSGLNLYCQIKPHNLTTVWNGSAFVAYDVGDWTDYVITLTESTPGAYYGTWPTGFATGYYDIFVYHGATPASSDLLVGSGDEYFAAIDPAPTLPIYGDAWKITRPQVEDKPLDTLYITEDTEQVLAFDYSNFREIKNGATVSSASFTPVAGLTISGVESGESVAMATFTGGAGSYEIICNASLSNGAFIKTKRRLIINAV